MHFFDYLCWVMDIDLLSRILKELVTDHDMVGLPGIGTFVTEVVPASFSDKGYTINPPYRRLSFVQGRVEDKLLIDFYSESNEVDVEVAEAYITQFLHEMKQVLKERKIILLPGLGRLRATKENNFFFVPEEDLDIYPDGFALKPVSLKNIQREMEPVHIPVSFAEAVQSLMEKKKAEPQPEAWPEQESLPQAEPQPEAEAEPESQPQAEVQPEPQLEQPELEADSEQVPEAQAEPEPKLRRELVPLDPEQVPYSGADIPLDPREINEAQFEPEREPEPQPEPEVQSQPEQQTEREPEQEAKPQPEQPETEQEAEPQPEQLEAEREPEQEAQPQPEQEPEPQPEQQAEPQPEQQAEREPEPQPESQSESEPEQEAQPRQRQRRRWWVVLLVVVALLAVALGVFVILAHAAPDFIDSILYTPEELRIINA